MDHPDTRQLRKRSSSTPPTSDLRATRRSRQTPHVATSHVAIPSSSSVAVLSAKADSKVASPTMEEKYGTLTSGRTAIGSSPQEVVASQMEESQEYFDASSQPMEKGKERIHTTEEPERKEVEVFRLMDLPTEIRLEIYRACLTRPYKILLSKVEKPPPAHLAAIQAAEHGTSFTYGLEDMVEDSDDEAQDSSALVPHNGTSTLPALSRLSGASQRRHFPPAGRTYGRSRRTATARPAPRMGGLSLPRSSTVAPMTVTPMDTSSNVQARSSSHVVPPYGNPHWAHAASPDDPLIINVLRASKQVYKEARGVLYSENIFDLNIRTAVTSLAALHQRSRRQIKHIELEIPTYTEILESFSEIVRLSLRYCSGLKKFVIDTPFTLPGVDGAASASNTAVYANGFDILRWLPQQCEVVLVGSENAEIEAVVKKHLTLAKAQDKVTWAGAQFTTKPARMNVPEGWTEGPHGQVLKDGFKIEA